MGMMTHWGKGMLRILLLRGNMVLSDRVLVPALPTKSRVMRVLADGVACCEPTPACYRKSQEQPYDPEEDKGQGN